MRLSLFLLLSLVPLAACDTRPPPAPDQAVPKALCVQVKKGLDALGKSGSFEITGRGEAAVSEALWGTMTTEQRDQLIKLLAYDASCAAGAQSDAQSVVVRGDEGTDLTRRTVSTRVDAGEVLSGAAQDVAR